MLSQSLTASAHSPRWHGWVFAQSTRVHRLHMSSSDRPPWCSPTAAGSRFCPTRKRACKWRTRSTARRSRSASSTSGHAIKTFRLPTLFRAHRALAPWYAQCSNLYLCANGDSSSPTRTRHPRRNGGARGVQDLARDDEGALAQVKHKEIELNVFRELNKATAAPTVTTPVRLAPHAYQTTHTHTHTAHTHTHTHTHSTHSAHSTHVTAHARMHACTHRPGGRAHHRPCLHRDCAHRN